MRLKGLVERLATAKIFAHLKQKILDGRFVKIDDKNVDGRHEVRSHAEHEREILRNEHLVGQGDPVERNDTRRFRFHELHRDWAKIFPRQKLEYLVQVVSLKVGLNDLPRFVGRN